MPFSNASDYWQKAIYFFTGYDAPHIDKLFSEWVGNDDIPLMKVEITKQKRVTYVDVDDLQWRIDNAGRDVNNTDFVIPFYKTGNEEESGDEALGDTITYYKARFTLLGNHNGKDRPSGGVYEGGEHKARYDNDFKKSDEGTTWDTGPHTQYSYGTGRALEAVLDNEGGTRGFEWNGIDVPAERVVDLASFGRAADAFDRVAQFYVDRQAELEEWHKRVGMQENKAWKGTAAGVFWDLIHKLNKRYEDYAEDLRNGAMFSVPGDAIRIAGDEFRKAARKLQQEWAVWEARDGNPLSFLSDLLSEIVDHVWDTNISNITYKVHTVARGGTRTTYHATEHFRQDAIDKKGHNYGPLSSLETWKAVGEAAIERWKDSVKENLIDNADIALKTVHDAWSPSVFDVGTVKTSSGDSLSQDYEKDKADKEKEEAEKKEEKYRKEQEEKEEKYRKEQEEKEKKAKAEADGYRKEQEEKEEKYRKEQEEKEKKAKAEADGYRKEQEEKEEKYRKEQEEKEKKAEAEADRKEKDQEKKQAEAEAKQEKYLKEQEAKQAEAKEGQEQKEKEAEQKQAAKEKEQEQKQAQAEKEQEQKQKEQEAKQEQKEKEAKQEQEQAKKEAEAKQAEQEKKQAQAEKEQEQKQAEAEKEQEQKEKEAEAKQAEQQKKQEEYQRQQQQVQLGQVAQQKAEQDRAKKKQEQEQQEQEQKQAQAEKEQEQKQKEQEAKQEQKEKEAEQEQEQAKKEAEAKQAEQEKKQEQEQRQAKQEQEEKEKEAEAKQAEQEQKQEQYQKEQEQKQAQAEKEQEQAKKEAEAKQAEQEKKQEQEQREAEKEQEQAKKEAEADQREQRKKQEEYQQRQQQYQEEQQQRQEQQQEEQQKKQEEYQQRQQEYQDKQYQQQEQQQQRQYQQEQQRYQQEQKQEQQRYQQEQQLEQQRYQQEQQQYQQQQEHSQQQQEQYQKQQDQALNRIGGALNGDNLPPLSHDPITGPVNGDDSLHNPGGSESHIDSHGRVVTEYPDGHTTTIDPDTQTSSITTPDGHTRSGRSTSITSSTTRRQQVAHRSAGADRHGVPGRQHVHDRSAHRRHLDHRLGRQVDHGAPERKRQLTPGLPAPDPRVQLRPHRRQRRGRQLPFAVRPVLVRGGVVGQGPVPVAR
ncbi:AAWKG family protein [Streptomyces sp. FXJ1.4098]|nr:AAWKG family protein [Streptomyces sp. FXJ1.4098]